MNLLRKIEKMGQKLNKKISGADNSKVEELKTLSTSNWDQIR